MRLFKRNNKTPENRLKNILQHRKKHMLIFTFGATGSGKSTLLAALLNRAAKKRYEKYINTENELSKQVVESFLNLHRSNQLPEITHTLQEQFESDFLYYDLLLPDNPPMTFFELSGEDLEDIDPQFSQVLQHDSTSKDAEAYFSKPNSFGTTITELIHARIPHVFLLTASYENAAEEDELLNMFLSYLRENFKQAHQIIGIGIIITMWDKNEDPDTQQRKYSEPESFINHQLPMTTAQLLQISALGIPVHALPFSVGKVEGSTLKQFKRKFSNDLLQWMSNLHNNYMQ